MKKNIIKVLLVVTACVCCFFVGTTQSKTEVKTVTRQVKTIPDGYINTDTDDFYNNYIDMRDVTDFSVNGDSLQLYTVNGDGYYWER